MKALRKISYYMFMICAILYLAKFICRICLGNEAFDVVFECIYWAFLALSCGCRLIVEFDAKKNAEKYAYSEAKDLLPDRLKLSSFVEEADWLEYKRYRESLKEQIQFWRFKYLKETKLLSDLIIKIISITMMISVIYFITTLI